MNDKNNVLYFVANKSHLIMLIVFTIMEVIFFGEVIFAGWERYIGVLAVAFIVISWQALLLNRYSGVQLTRLYAFFMMISYFLYGTHIWGAYNLSVIIVAMMLLFTMSREKWLIWLAVLTYIFTLTYLFAKTSLQLLDIIGLTPYHLVSQLFLVFFSACFANYIIYRVRISLGAYSRDLKENEEQKLIFRERMGIVAREMGNVSKDAKGELLYLKNTRPGNCCGADIPADLYNLYVMQEKLEEYTQNLSDYTDIISKKTVVNEEVYEITDLVSQLKVIPEIRLYGYKCEIAVDIDPMIPKALVGDRDKIFKILRHLISNGLRYTKEGGIKIRIYSLAHAGDLNLCIEVNDTGIGIERTDLEYMLEQINDRLSEYRPGGLGAGLFIVNGFVKAMGGFFRIESELGEGTSVCVSIPQSVSNAVPCLSFDYNSGICMAFEEKIHTGSRISDFFEEVLLNFAEKLNVDIYYVKNKDDLMELTRAYKKVCFFVLSSEYETRREYYDGLSKDVFLTVITDKNTQLEEESTVNILKKPFSSLELLNVIEKARKTSINRRRRDDEGIDESLRGRLHAESIVDRNVRRQGGRKIMITTDSMSDITLKTSSQRGIAIIPFRIYTEDASFLDGIEISQECALRYFKEGGIARSMAPEEDEYRQFFEKNLKYADHIIYLSTASKVSKAFSRASKVASEFDNVTVINSGQVSGGLAMLTIMADEQVKAGRSLEEVIKFIEKIKPKIRTSFLIDNLQHLEYIGVISRGISFIGKALKLHPIIAVRHDKMGMSYALFGNLNDAREAYIKKILKNKDKIDTDRAFVGLVGIPHSEVLGLEHRLHSEGFGKVVLKRSSAAISINCGVGTFGIIYLEK